MPETQQLDTDIPTPVLMLPGIGDSGPAHWQSLWQAANPGFRRVLQRDWDHPVCHEWVTTLEDTLQEMRGPVVLVAHSLGCLLVAHWAVSATLAVKGALLVAVPDPLGARFPREAQGFSPLPRAPLPFPSVVVASSDDPYAPIPHAQACAAAWGSRLVNIGAAGHVNAASGLGHWPAGQALLQALLR
jgi:uncharacterized protein